MDWTWNVDSGQAMDIACWECLNLHGAHSDVSALDHSRVYGTAHVVPRRTYTYTCMFRMTYNAKDGTMWIVPTLEGRTLGLG